MGGNCGNILIVLVTTFCVITWSTSNNFNHVFLIFSKSLDIFVTFYNFLAFSRSLASFEKLTLKLGVSNFESYYVSTVSYSTDLKVTLKC